MWERFADWLYRRSSLNRAKQQGFEFGIVVDTEDPWKLGRIRVRFPWHYSEDMSDWALPATGAKSDGTGSTFGVPQVDDLVLCVFYGGDVTRPAYLGSIWTGGGIGPRGKIKPRATLIEGYEPQPPDPESYDPNLTPNTSPQSYAEPPTGAWITNDPTTRVHEFKTFGGLRLIWEEMKRRLRFWSHPTSPFALTIEHFDGDSVDPPRAVPYHRSRFESPKGTYVEIEEDDSVADYVTQVTFHTGLKIVLEQKTTAGTHKMTLTTPGGEKLVIDEVNHTATLQDRGGGKVVLDEVNKTRQLVDPAGNTVTLDETAQSITVSSPGDIAVNATGTLTLNGGAGVDITSGGNINIG